MHGELVNAVHTAVRCQMCVLERTLKNGKTIFIKILRNDIRMSCTEPGLSHSTCWVQIHSVVFLTPKSQISALRSNPYRRHYSAFFCCSEVSSEKLLFYPENVSRASYYELFAADENQKNPFTPVSTLLLLPVTNGHTIITAEAFGASHCSLYWCTALSTD